jgi:hypothetical protein
VSRRGGAPLNRRRPNREPRRRVLVFTEGRKTEPSYLTALWRAHRDIVSIEVSDEHGTPMTLVRHALAAMSENANAKRKGRGDVFDEIWCMFDVDEHPDVRTAITTASGKRIGVAVSNPCVELWFVLHWEEQTAEIDRDAAQRRSASYVGNDKNVSDSAFAALMGRYSDAKARAMALEDRHRGNGTEEPGNPSSTVWRLVDAIRLAE